CGGEIAHWHCQCRHGYKAAQRSAGDHTDGESFHGTLPIGSARPVTSHANPGWAWMVSRAATGGRSRIVEKSPRCPKRRAVYCSLAEMPGSTVAHFLLRGG